MRKVLFFATMLILVSSCGKDGKTGVNGLDGNRGDKGDKGEAGANASAIPVKFCPNLIDSYGTHYSEQGLCIDNKVYAVYSTNKQAFLTELSNGRYVTTTPFGNCTFIVSDNCTVTQE